MSDLFTKLPLFIANADREIFDRSPVGETTIIKAIGWAIIIASAVAAIAFFVFLKSLSGSIVLGFGGAFVMVVIIVLFDRTLLRDESAIKLGSRFLISVCIALFISVPVKVNMAEDSLKSYIIETTARHNQDLRDQVYTARQEIDARLDKVGEDIIEASERDAQGNIIQIQRLIELRRLKKELIETRDQRIADVERSIVGQLQTPDTSFVAQMGTFIDLTVHPEKANDPIAIFLNIVILLLFILTEALPSILRMTLQRSSYIRAVEFKNNLIMKIQVKIEEVQTLLIESDSLTVTELLMKRQEYLTELSRTAVHELRNTKELQLLYGQVLELEENYRNQFKDESKPTVNSEGAVKNEATIVEPSQNGAVQHDPESPIFTYE